MISKGDLLTLEDSKNYFVAADTEINGQKYLYLIEKERLENFMICKLETDEVATITDASLKKELLITFNKILNNYA